MPLRILLADDHAILRDGLRALLEAAGYQIAGETGHGRETLRLVRELRPDVVVVDIAMPGLNGVDATRAIQRESPDTRVVVLTVHEEEAYVAEALRAGARGYVLKTQASADLVLAIEEAQRGGIYLSPRVSSSLVEAFRAGTPCPQDPLTPREREVLQLIAEGKSTKEVAAALGVSTKTAETHRGRLMSKLGIHHTAGLVRYALRRGLAGV
jgi:DNA-binding NarL/FixJ family response regulator